MDSMLHSNSRKGQKLNPKTTRSRKSKSKRLLSRASFQHRFMKRMETIVRLILSLIWTKQSSSPNQLKSYLIPLKTSTI